jgi:hypothetical protein
MNDRPYFSPAVVIYTSEDIIGWFVDAFADGVLREWDFVGWKWPDGDPHPRAIARNKMSGEFHVFGMDVAMRRPFLVEVMENVVSVPDLRARRRKLKKLKRQYRKLRAERDWFNR